MSAYTYLGKSFPHTQDNEKITGRAAYAADLRLDHMLWAKILHSPLSHARIRSIDTSGAERLPGVKAVVTAKDTTCARVGRGVQDRPLFAFNEVKYKGEPVAAVAAVDEQTALDALELIRVDYEELPAVFDSFEALKPDSVRVHEDNETFEPRPPTRKAGANIIDRARVVEGNFEKAMGECDVIHQDSYHTQIAHPGYMEPHAAVARVDDAGNATLWCSTKAPFAVREHTSKFLNIPISRLRVIASTVGGDFGGKGTATVEPISVLLAMKSGCPVKLVLTREEEFSCIPQKASTTMELTLGAKKDGTLWAVKGKIVLDSGAYYDNSGRAEGNALKLMGVYRIPNIDLEAVLVYTNNPPKGHVRAPSGPPPAFAIESHMDALSRKLGLDPLAFRLKNIVQDQDHLAGGKGILHPEGLKPTLLAAREYLDKEKGRKEKNKGWGVACGLWSTSPVRPGGQASSAWVKINEDGSVQVITGATDQGGGQYSAFAQIVSEVLSVPYDSVSVIGADTAFSPDEKGTGGSQTTYRVGISVKLAAEDARQQLLELASDRLDAGQDILDIRDGKVFIKEAPERSIGLRELAASSLSSPQGPIIGVGRKEREAFLAQMKSYRGQVDMATFSTHVAQVEIDPETGLVKILKYFAAHEVGLAINPDNVKKQIEGGVVFGLGYALSEEVKVQQGNTLTDSFMDYKMPTMTLAPEITYKIIELPCKFGPFGAKGIGEPPVVPVAPAIANAVFDAIGVRIKDLPITPEKIFSGLKRTG
ncbi:MAG: xanthine dehydrogenase family protein molybdopterin-binding subunit [Desulfobacterales bacterium]|nr:xanthine dehydrogenase family protein molybdopterin-binding subunit [Desulfobacterales bacterium]